MTLNSESSVGLSSRGQSSKLSMLVLGSGDPVDSWIVSDGVMGWVDKNDLIVFVGSVLGNPVTVQDSESLEGSAGSLLSLGSEVSGGLQLIDTNRGWLSSDDTLGDWSLPATSSNSDSVDDIAVFGLESQSSGFVGSGRLVGPVDDWQLSVLPSPDSENEVHSVGLFLPPEFFEILVGSHVWLLLFIY